ncbi:MAG TPA: protein-methionine-sulfoxide reductase heme-binding subunit MsrQ [Anaerolineales bacterium]|nr:protein-methionine-sulfoxide reductase heme-binding subunit MsrQ [Anaerolineales bacterium]
MKLLKFSPLQWVVHLGSLTPLAVLIVDAMRDNLSANPIQDVTFRTGKTALVLLVLSLAATPVNTIFGYRQALKVRRALGLYAFFYVSLHFLIFVGLDYTFDLELIYAAIAEKRYARVGFSAALILLPLAITSTKSWMRRLGKRWKQLHRLVYLAALLAFIHYLWLVKADIREPLAYGGVIGLLLIARLPFVRRWATNLRLTLKSRLANPKRGPGKPMIRGNNSAIEKQNA